MAGFLEKENDWWQLAFKPEKEYNEKA